MPVSTPQQPLPTPSRPDFSAMEAQHEAEQKAFDQKIAPLEAKKEAATQDYMQALSAPRPAVPQTQPIQQFQPRQVSQQEMQNFMGIATVFAALASMKTREPFAAALNSAGDAFKGFQQGNLAQAKVDIENFNTKARAAIEENQRLMDQYGAVLNDWKLNAEQKHSILSVISLEMGDMTSHEMLKANQDIAFYTKIDAMQRAHEQLDVQVARLNETLRHNLETEEQRRKQQAAQSGVGGPAQNAADELIVKKIGNYEIPLPSGWALRSPYWQHILGMLSKEYPDYDATLYQRKQRAETDMAAGMTGRLTRSFNVFIQHTEVMRDAVEALRNGNIKQFNKAAQLIAEQTGYPAPTTFDAVKQIYGDELVKAIVGTGGNVSDRERAAEAITKAQSPDQLMNILDNYDRLMAGQVMGVRHQYEAATGKKDFDSFLLPKTLTVLRKYGYGEQAIGKSYPTEKAAEDAAARGEIKPGDKITVNGIKGTWH